MRQVPTRVLLTTLAVVAVSALVLAACGGGNTPQPATQQAPAPANQAQPPAAVPQPAQAATPAPAETAPAAATALAPVATPAAAPAAPSSPLVQEHETGVEVTLVEARRTAGDSVTVKWRYRNGLPGAVQIAKGGSSWTDPYQLTMSAFLVDPVNKKKYLVITDAEKIPLTSKHGDWQGVTLAPGQILSSWAKFPAPPAGVEKVTVTLPGVAPFEDVPIVK
jgi:hypothetical protein